MTSSEARQRQIERRANLPTAMSSREISREIPARIRARSFFSSRVAAAHVVDRFRSISDDYLAGRIGRDEARALMRTYARDNGLDDGTGALTNLASTSRLELILDQNEKMSRAVGDYARMYSDANLRVFPYVIYHASVGSKEPRSEHQRYDGMVFDKNDPWLRTHWPPWEFGCNCQLENISRKEAERLGLKVQPPTPPERVKVESKSGFSFDPADAFGEEDLSSLSSESRGMIREGAEIELGDQVAFKNDNATAKITPREYQTFDDENLPSASEWSATPAPERMAPNDARKRLETGFEVKTGDGRTATMDKAVLDHWEIETAKTARAIESRLASLNYAIATLMYPMERWDQDTQVRYLKMFRKTTGGAEGCMVVVTRDGKCRTYFLPSANQLNKARRGIAYEVIDKKEGMS